MIFRDVRLSDSLLVNKFIFARIGIGWSTGCRIYGIGMNGYCRGG